MKTTQLLIANLCFLAASLDGPGAGWLCLAGFGGLFAFGFMWAVDIDEEIRRVEGW